MEADSGPKLAAAERGLVVDCRAIVNSMAAETEFAAIARLGCGHK
jgi:hypothetical protein